ncbi:MAG: hypothetical protein IAF94_09390 [Pirellulaceae bacterium]|nr:hypothetical protein [Pirellulaceae bacterium]
MVRTTLSFCVLFGFLVAGFAVLQQAGPDPSSPTGQSPASSEREQPQPRLVARAAEKVSFISTPVSAEDLSLMLVSYEEQSFTDDFDRQGESSEPKADNTKTEETTDESKFFEQASEEKKELTPEQKVLREKLRDVLAHYYQQPENVASRSPWGAMHAMIAYGVDTELIAQNKKVNAIGYLCYNGNCNGQTLFWVQNNKLQTKIGPGVQGHAGQFLAMLAQSRVRTDYPMKVDSFDFKVADLIEHEKHTCQPRTELTFKLIALVHYLKSDDKWKSFDNQDWDIPRLIKEELAQPIVGAACGGTHRLTGFSYAVHKRQQRKEPMDGQWARARKFIEEYHAYTFKLQNPDGSYSTNWFAGREDNGPPSRRLETTGHITEWLAYSLSEEELQDPRMVKSVDYLANLLLDGRNEKWAIGPLGHGLHALAIYDERVFGGKPGQRSDQLARQVKPLLRRK